MIAEMSMQLHTYEMGKYHHQPEVNPAHPEVGEELGE
jgi:hypothetical protein